MYRKYGEMAAVLPKKRKMKSCWNLPSFELSDTNLYVALKTDAKKEIEYTYQVNLCQFLVPFFVLNIFMSLVKISIKPS